jgi:hypothetical protein
MERIFFKELKIVFECKLNNTKVIINNANNINASVLKLKIRKIKIEDMTGMYKTKSDSTL